MKFPRFHRFLTICNDASQDVINAIAGAFQDITVAEGEKRQSLRFALYGSYPQKLPTGQTIIQVVDEEAADQIIANFGRYGGLDTFFKGVPVYEGHADDPDWLKANPGHKASAVGRIKAITKGEDGIYVETVFNSDGLAMLSGEAPRYTGHSPRWRCAPVPGKAGHFRPVLLWSDALTNSPNIPGSIIAMNEGGATIEIESPDSAANGGETENQENTDMKLTPEALAALGFAPDAEPSPEEISAAIVKMLADKATADAGMVAANSRVQALESTITNIRGPAVDTVINAAITDGRITEADKPKWIDALNTDFAGESAKLGKLMPVLNTANRVVNLAERRGEQAEAPTGIDAINAAVRAYAAEQSIDISNNAGYTKAFEGAKAAKPEIFARGK